MGYVVSGESEGWDDGRVVKCKSGIFYSTKRSRNRYSSISREGWFSGPHNPRPIGLLLYYSLDRIEWLKIRWTGATVPLLSLA